MSAWGVGQPPPIGRFALPQRSPPWLLNRASDYVQERELGKGAYGTVYQVLHRPTGQKYAMKRISVQVTTDGVPQSVMREIAALVALKRQLHPNVTRLHDVYHTVVEASRLQINVICELCDWDLFTFLRDIPKDMGDAQCRLIARQIFAGVDFLHSNNIIHRDLKPQNILINRDQTVKIADFGLARMFSSVSSFTPVVVTLWYRSPELLLQCDYNTAVDVWSAGLILAELYSRQALIPGSTEAQQLLYIFQKLGTPPLSEWPAQAVVTRDNYASYPAKPFNVLVPQLPADALPVMNACLKFNPQLRATAAELLRMPFFTTPITSLPLPAHMQQSQQQRFVLQQNQPQPLRQFNYAPPVHRP